MDHHDDLEFYDDDFEDDEYPDAYDGDADDAELIACPHCGAEIYEDSVQCPICSEYVSLNTSPWALRSWWWIGLGLAGIAATMIALALM